MKKRLASGYTFDASAKTIVHADFSDITLEGIQLITNVTDQIIIYNFADTTKGGTLSTDTLTLEYDTTSMDDTDKLMILVEDGVTTQPVSGTVAVTQSGTWDEVGINDSGNSLTVDQPTGSNLHTVVDSGTITTVSAVTAISNALPAGTNAIGKLAANNGVDIGDVDVTTVGTITPGTASSSLGKAEDAAHSSGDVGVMSLGVGNEAQTTLAADGDYIAQATDTKGNNLVVGNVASGVADAGNPVKVGGKYNLTFPTFTDGQRGDLQLTARGSLRVTLVDAVNTTITGGADNADAVATTSTSARLTVLNRNTILNPSGTPTWDRQYTVVNAANSTGTGIAAAGILAQVDDTSPTAISENSFGNVRMSADHSVLVAPRATTPTQTSVASSASSVSLLAANNARKGATIYNDSTQILYLKLGATASTTSYTIQLPAAPAVNSYYEVPFGYVGAIDGIWASANGNARITELA